MSNDGKRAGYDVALSEQFAKDLGVKIDWVQVNADARVAALADDNTYLYAWAKDNPGYTVGSKTLGPQQTIAPAVKKGNTSLLNWVNGRIKALSEQGFFKKAYQKELAPSFTSDVKPSDVIIE